VDRLKAKRLRGIALRVVGVALVVAVLVWGARQVDFAQVAQTLRRTDPLLMSTAVPLLLAFSFLLRSLRFHVLVQALPTPSKGAPFKLWDSFKSLLASMAANNIVPLRLGELVRTRDLVARGYPLANVAVAQVTEKGVELSTLIACALPLVPLGLVRFPQIPRWAVGLGLGGFALVAGLLVWHRRTRRKDQPGLVVAPLAIARSAFWSFAADAAEVVLIAVCLKAVGIVADWRAAIAVLVGINLAISIPSTPAQLGAFEAGGALALGILGVAADQAVAFALLYRVVQWLPTTLVGGIILLAHRSDASRPLPAPGEAAPPAKGLGP
jgi:uncharacterized membrane protein YbhN (UPF0104 family)